MFLLKAFVWHTFCNITAKQILFMEQINIKVAFCLQCGGYHSSAPADFSQVNDPEVTDHFFYHGEPWFTLNKETFEKALLLEDTVVKTLSLSNHKINDKKYCKCTRSPKPVNKIQVYSFPVSDEILMNKNQVSDSELYFTEVYRLCYNFH